MTLSYLTSLLLILCTLAVYNHWSPNLELTPGPLPSLVPHQHLSPAPSLSLLTLPSPPPSPPHSSLQYVRLFVSFPEFTFPPHSHRLLPPACAHKLSAAHTDAPSGQEERRLRSSPAHPRLLILPAQHRGRDRQVWLRDIPTHGLHCSQCTVSSIPG